MGLWLATLGKYLLVFGCLAVVSPAVQVGATRATSSCSQPTQGNQGSPAVSGNTVVWVQQHGTKADIYGERLPASRTFRITRSGSVVAAAEGPAISAGRIVWVDCRLCVKGAGLPGFRNTKIYFKDLSGRLARPVARDGLDQYSPAISGDLVVWTDNRSGHSGIYAKNLSTGSEVRVAVGRGQKAAPAVSGHTVVWQDNRSGQWDIYGRSVSTGREFVIAQHRGLGNYLENPVISGSLVVWTSWNPGQSVVLEGKDLSTGRSFSVATIASGHYNPQLGPRVSISGHIVVWDEIVGSLSSGQAKYNVFAKDLPKGRAFLLASASGTQDAVAISGREVVWTSSSGNSRARRSVICATTLTSRDIKTDVHSVRRLSWHA
jgi:beta propeller repeat protein